MKLTTETGKSFTTITLTGKESYPVWSYTMREHLTTAGLLEAVTTSKPKLAKIDEQEETKLAGLEASKVQEAKSLLLSTLAASEIEKILHCQTAQEIWQHFELAYGAKSSNKKLELMSEMNSLKCASAKEVAAAVNKAMTIRGKLEALGVKIDETMLISVLMNAIPSKLYSVFLETWSMLDVEQQTLARFISKLLDKTKQLVEVEDTESAMMALRVQNSRGRGRGGRGRSGGHHLNNRPNYSNKQSPQEANWSRGGHGSGADSHSRNAPQDHVFQRSSTNSYNYQQPQSSNHDEQQKTCNYCKKIGHWKQDCRKLQYKLSERSNNNQRNNEQQSPRNNSNQNAMQAEEISFMAVEISPSVDDQSVESTIWLIDSGATSHMTSNFSLFDHFERFETPIGVRIGDDNVLEAVGRGLVNTRQCQLSVLYVPSMGQRNLFSIGYASQPGSKQYFMFCDSGVKWVQDDKIIFQGGRKGNSYYFNFDLVKHSPHHALTATTLDAWHQRLGHMPRDLIKKMATEGIVDGIKIVSKDNDECLDCKLNKCKRASHSTRTTPKATKPGQVMHFDVMGPCTQTGLNNQRFILVGKDEFSKMRLVSCLKSKSQVPETVKTMLSTTEMQTGNNILAIYTDNGSEFLSERLTTFLQHRGIVHMLSATYCPQQNGTAERENQSLLSQARTMLNASGLPKELWPEAVHMATYVSNRCITSKRLITPYELWFSRKPNLSNIRAFGQQASILLQDHQRSKFDPKGTLMFCVGYTDNFHTYKFFDLSSKKIVTSCDAIFTNQIGIDAVKSTGTSSSPQVAMSDNSEIHLPTQAGTDKTGHDTEHLTISKQADHQEAEASAEPQQQDSKADESLMCDEPSIYTDSRQDLDGSPYTSKSVNDPQATVFNVISTEKPIGKLFGASSSNTQTNQGLDNDATERHTRGKRINYSQMAKGNWNLDQAAEVMQESVVPKSIREALSREDASKWIEAAEREMESIIANDVFQLVPRPNCNVVGCRWVFVQKLMPDGSFKPKARLVAQGFTQEFGVDYTTTFAPVVHMDFVRFLFSLAAQLNLFISQCDIKTAFLYGRLEEKIFMEQPDGFQDGTNSVWLLKRSLYGLKQSPKCWNTRFTEFLSRSKLKVATVDGCIYYGSDLYLIVAIYVDDLIILSKEENHAKDLIKKLSSEFDLHLIQTNKFLGFQYFRHANGDITIHQSNYVTNILKRYGMWESNPSPTPILPAQKAGNEEVLDDNREFREIVGALQYAASQTRLDIAFTVGLLGRRVLKPTNLDWQIMKRCLRYLRGTVNLGITYRRRGSPGLVAYADADFAGDLSKYKSTTGQLIIHSGGPIAWKSKLQKTVVTSTTEAEYLAVSSTIKTVLCIKNLGSELKALDPEPVPLFCDNRGAVLITANETSTQRTRHMGAQLSFAREHHRNKSVKVQHISSNDQAADLFTKPLSTDKFVANRNRLMFFLTILLMIMTLSSPESTFATKEVMKPIDKVIFLLTPNFVEAGKTMNDLELPIFDRCKHLRNLSHQNNVSSSLHHLYLNAANSCSEFRRSKYLPIVNSLDNLKFPTILRKIRESKVEFNEDPLEMEGPWSYYSSLIGSIIGVPEIVQRKKVHTPYNRVFVHDKIVRQLVASNNIHSEQIQQIINANKNTTGVIKTLLDQVNTDHGQLKDVATTLPKMIAEVSRATSDIQRDTDLLLDLRTHLARGHLDMQTLAKLMPERHFEKPMSTEETTVVRIEVLTEQKIHIEYYSPIVDTAIEIYKIETFLNWNDWSTFREYTGPTFMMHNRTNWCTRFIDPPERLSIKKTCTTANQTLNFEEESYWSRKKDTPLPKLIFANGLELIQCYPSNITFANVTRRCPEYPFSLPVEMNFTVGDVDHCFTKQSLAIKEDGESDLKIIADWLTDEWANKYKEASSKLALAEQSLSEAAKLQEENPLIVLAKGNPYAAIGISTGTMLLIIVIIIIIAIYCKNDPLVEIAKTSLVSSMANRDKSVSTPALVQPTCPSICINIGSSLRTINNESYMDERQVKFDNMYPQLNSMLTTRPPTPYCEAINESTDLADKQTTCSIASSKSCAIPIGPQAETQSIASRASTIRSQIKDGLRNTIPAIKRFPLPKTLSTVSLPNLKKSTISLYKKISK
jgi:hypothetical protein